MALVLADRVKDTTTTTGTGTVTLSGTAPTGYQNFAVIGNGNTTYYTIAGGSEWEVGVGTYATSGPTLARTTVLASTNGGSAVSFSAGTKDVFVTYPAEVATALTNPIPTNGGVVYGTGTAIGVSAAGVVNGYQFLQSAGAASPTWVQINSFKDVAVAPSSPTPIEGDRFFDNTTGIDYTYITDVDGSQWVETSATGAASNVYTKTTFTATASQTTFTLNYNVGYVDVYLNGVKLTTSDYTASTGTTVVLGVAAALNDIVETIAWTTWSVTNTAIGAGTGTSLVLSGAATALTFNGSTLANHTRQVFLSGSSATYTTPANVRQIVVRVKGAGGGGPGNGNNTTTVGGNGGTSSFNSVVANGGTGGSLGSTTFQGAGGTGGTGTASFRLAGCAGTLPVPLPWTATNWLFLGGNGGGQGGGFSGNGATGGSGVANSGGGGASGPYAASSQATLSTLYFGGGGGEGEYLELIINSPAATYTYTVGSGGSGGTGGAGYNGGAGGSGVIIVDEYY